MRGVSELYEALAGDVAIRAAKTDAGWHSHRAQPCRTAPRDVGQKKISPTINLTRSLRFSTSTTRHRQRCRPAMPSLSQCRRERWFG